MTWDHSTEEKFREMLNQIPVFTRKMAERMVRAKAISNAEARAGSQVEIPDLVQAFLTECPGPFRPLMLEGLERLGLDYRKYQTT